MDMETEMGFGIGSQITNLVW